MEFKGNVWDAFATSSISRETISENTQDFDRILLHFIDSSRLKGYILFWSLVIVLNWRVIDSFYHNWRISSTPFIYVLSHVPLSYHNLVSGSIEESIFQLIFKEGGLFSRSSLSFLLFLDSVYVFVIFSLLPEAWFTMNSRLIIASFLFLSLTLVVDAVSCCFFKWGSKS